MRTDNPTEQFAAALYRDMHKRGFHSASQYMRLYCFTQEWGSTALGFGGMGGASMTTAMTSVFANGNEWSVYFGGRHAYDVSSPNEKFRGDLAAHRMASIADSHKYEDHPNGQ